MSALEILKAAREKISIPEAWTQGTFARRADGHITTTTHPDAVCWCAAGAIHAVCPAEHRGEAYREATVALRSVVGAIAPFNDAATHDEVLAAFDAAIRRLESA